MTTIAWDGKTMAADTLGTDHWGLKEKTLEKIWANKYLLIGGAGESGQILSWLVDLTIDTSIDDILKDGYKHYEKDKNEPHLLVVDRLTLRAYRHVGARFIPIHREFFAIGSGRDYALMAMHLGKTAVEAVELAKVFDNGTGGEVISFEVVA